MKKDDPVIRQRRAVLKRAIAAAGGTQASLAARLRECGKDKASQQLISYWFKNGSPIGPEWWAAIERATNGAVTRRDLRPDVFAAEHVA